MKNFRFLVPCVLFLVSVFLALGSASVYPDASKAQAQSRPRLAAPAVNASSGPDVVRLVGPVRLDQDLRMLPYIPNEGEIEERQRRIFPFPLSGGRASSRASSFPRFQSLLEKIVRPVPNMELWRNK